MNEAILLLSRWCLEHPESTWSIEQARPTPGMRGFVCHVVRVVAMTSPNGGEVFGELVATGDTAMRSAAIGAADYLASRLVPAVDRVIQSAEAWLAEQQAASQAGKNPEEFGDAP